MQVVTLPEGEDPDTFVAKNGGEKLVEQLAASVDVFERKIHELERGGWFADLRKKRQAIDKLLPTLRATADALTRDMYIARASEVVGRDARGARSRGIAECRRASPRRASHSSRPPEPPPPEDSAVVERRTTARRAPDFAGTRPRSDNWFVYFYTFGRWSNRPRRRGARPIA